MCVYHIFGPRESGGCGDKSGGGFCCFLIVLILFQGCECRYFASGATTGSGRGSTIRNKLKKKRKMCVCLIVFGGSLLGVLYGYFTRCVRKKQGSDDGTALLDALAGRFICFGESDVNPRVIQRGRIGGPGRE